MLIHGNKCYDPSLVITSYMYCRKEIRKNTPELSAENLPFPAPKFY